MNFALMNTFASGKTTAGSFLKRVGDSAVNLRVTEKILTEIERRLFTADHSQFDIEFVRANLIKLKSLAPETPSNEFLQIEFSLDQEFKLWRGLLEERDRKIETYHLRRFFDIPDQDFDRAIFVALGYFYRSSAFYVNNLSKFDLVITRLYSVGSPAHREARLSRHERTAQLNAMFAEWSGEEYAIGEPSVSHSDAVEQIDGFISEARNLVDFEDLIQSKIFDRLRALKRDLGPRFFEPDVAAVSVEANLALGNVFNQLLAQANRNLGEKLNGSFDFAGAYHDSSENTRAHVSEVIQQFRAETSKASDPDVEHIWNLLDHVCGNAGAVERPAEGVFSPAIPKTANERLAPLLVTLQETEPDVRMLREYTQHSKALWTIDLNDFIRADEPELDRLCRDVLRLILLTDELCTHELNQPKDIAQATYDELSEVFQKSIQLGEVLENVLETSTGSLQNRLLVVSNKFLETRLRLERTIVRFSNHHLGLVKPAPSEPEPIAEPAPQISAPPEKHRTNRWLMALTVLVAILSGGAYWAIGEFESYVPPSPDFEEINVVELPTSEHLVNAYRHETTLFVITRETWDGLPEDEKRSALEKFTGLATTRKIETVIVTNSEGRPMADASANGLNVSPDL